VPPEYPANEFKQLRRGWHLSGTYPVANEFNQLRIAWHRLGAPILGSLCDLERALCYRSFLFFSISLTLFSIFLTALWVTKPRTPIPPKLMAVSKVWTSGGSINAEVIENRSEQAKRPNETYCILLTVFTYFSPQSTNIKKKGLDNPLQHAYSLAYQNRVWRFFMAQAEWPDKNPR
jgi:hypothetical protein